VNSQKTRESIQQAREWGRAEYETKTKGLIFTKDFQSRQEALMHDPLATVGERVMAWILRRSWGEYVLYAMREDGEPAYQRDCARELKLDKVRVSRAVAYYQQRGYLEDRPKLLYPVISPVLTAPDPKDKKLQEYATFLEDWKVANSSNFEALEVARSTIEEIRKVILSDYKKWKEQKRKADATLLETAKSNSETGSRAAVSPLEASNLRHKQAPAENRPVEDGVQSKTHARALLFSEIQRMQKQYPDSAFGKPMIHPENRGDEALVDRILQELGSYNDECLIGYLVLVASKFKGIGMAGRPKTPRVPGSATGPHSLGLLVEWAKDYARMARGGGGTGGAGATA